MKFLDKRVELGKRYEETMMLARRAQAALQDANTQLIALKAQLDLLEELDPPDDEAGAKVVKFKGE